MAQLMDWPYSVAGPILRVYFGTAQQSSDETPQEGPEERADCCACATGGKAGVSVNTLPTRFWQRCRSTIPPRFRRPVWLATAGATFTLLLGVMFTVSTGKGTIIIECDEKLAQEREGLGEPGWAARRGGQFPRGFDDSHWAQHIRLGHAGRRRSVRLGLPKCRGQANGETKVRVVLKPALSEQDAVPAKAPIYYVCGKAAPGGDGRWWASFMERFVGRVGRSRRHRQPLPGVGGGGATRPTSWRADVTFGLVVFGCFMVTNALNFA